MRSIRRAAVTGVFAMWLAPLPAPAADGSGVCCSDRAPRAERAMADRARGGRDEATEESREEG
jgi:hypothetical protein